MNYCKSKSGTWCIGTFLFVLYSCFSVFGQNVKDTVWVPVTYYDFHSNGTNPEFEQNIYTGVSEGMVQDTLDSERKPIATTDDDDINRNAYIKYWFRSWADSAKGDSTRPTYENNVDGVWGRYLGIEKIGHDTSFKNIVFKDSLPFTLLADGRYQYNNKDFFPLDGKGFGAENSGYKNNFSFTMELHWEFEMSEDLVFDFEGDDDVWAFIDNKLVMDLGGRHGPEEGSFDLNDFRDKNDKKLVAGQKYMLDFFFAERHQTGSTITITTNIISVKPQKVDLKAEPNDTVPIFTPIDLSGIVLDDTGGTIDSLTSRIEWRFIDDGGNPESSLKDNGKGKAQLIPEIPERWVTIEGFIPLEDGDTLFDTLEIYVTKGEPYKVWIEAVGLDTTTEDYRRNPKRLDEITIGADMNTAEVYAVVRDKAGYYLRKADPEWESRNELLVTVKGKNNKEEYHGIITRVGPNDSDYVTATEGTLEYDSVLVKVVNYYIDSLILVYYGTYDKVESIEMETDSTAKFEVYGVPSTVTDPDKRADYNNWVRTNVQWVIDNGKLKFEFDLPKLAALWECSPNNPGKGTLTLSIPSESRTPELEVPVTFTKSAPSYIDIKLISPESDWIAGKTLKAEVSIRNKDGLVPGDYCFGEGGEDPSKVVYYDTLSRGGSSRPKPQITVDGVKTDLNTSSKKDIKHNQCFNDGVDTIEFVLYYAPFNYEDSLHQITVILNKELQAKTKRFRLRTGTIEKIEITDNKREPLDTIKLSVDESKYAYITGYDEYGNEAFPVTGKWTSDGNIPELSGNAASVFIDASGITQDALGNVCATTDKDVSDCVPVILTGPGATLVSAITRDKNGNGYLDCIELYFNYPVDISRIRKSDFIVTRGSTNIWDVKDDITSIKGDNTAYAINLVELDNKIPQTAWLLNVEIRGYNGVNDIEKLATTDGAPPVVWEVEKTTVLPNDHSKDEVVITLTEPIYGPNGYFDLFSAPEEVFYVYVKELNGNFKSVPLFDGIKKFNSIGNALNYKGNQLKLTMTNGNDITANNWININYKNELLVDSIQNKPDEKNQKVKVTVKGNGAKITVGPIPNDGGFKYHPKYDINLTHTPEAAKWARDMGFSIKVDIIPPAPGDSVAAYFKVYDAVGNMVNQGSNKNFLEKIDKESIDTTSTVQVVFYWNGSSKKGMLASPGIYKYIFNYEYHGKKKYSKQEPIIGFIGISKRGSKKSR